MLPLDYEEVPMKKYNIYLIGICDGKKVNKWHPLGPRDPVWETMA